MNDNLQTIINNLPTDPSVYLYKDKNNKIIYVGKAKNLRNRVRQYFQNNLQNPKTIILVQKINDIEYIVTDSELEALVLENNLIKTYKPRYNILLKDDKSYPYITITNELFPRVFVTRTILNDGSKYFGPYTDVKALRSSLKLITNLFKIRSCKYNITYESIEKRKYKLCLDYHIRKCDGPCEGLISVEAYRLMIDKVEKILRGYTDDLIEELKFLMKSYAQQLQFEKAAELRDQINELEVYSQKQKIITTDFQDRDIFAIAYLNKDCIVTIFNIRKGKLINRKNLRITLEISDTIDGIYSSIIKQYYNLPVEIPNEIILPEIDDEIEDIITWLSSKANKNITIKSPDNDEITELYNLCKTNADLELKEFLIQKTKKDSFVNHSVYSLQRDLRLKNLPMRIECFDISNLQGSDIVASMVVFENGKPKKSEYRKFIIQTVNEGKPNDFASMYEVIHRRFKRLLEENQPMPDLIMIDGGKGQLNSAIKALKELKIKNYNIIGLAKRLEEIVLPNQEETLLLPRTSSSLKLLQNIRDEAHRFAITFHRIRREKRIITTELTQIDGIGERIANKLLIDFGSVENIKKLSVEELAKSIGNKKAEIVYNYFNNKNSSNQIELNI
ncbi:MAG TPA: excinuclease ABC subunit UvrC [Ignavibacteriales bacterium]|nr:excinuclease ABC subunit UvrC [Ignavibacteriales bacterium]